jgi:hypothetical protein
MYSLCQEFHAATQPVPQPFYIRTRIPRGDVNVQSSVEENAKTDETLIVTRQNPNGK